MKIIKNTLNYLKTNILPSKELLKKIIKFIISIILTIILLGGLSNIVNKCTHKDYSYEVYMKDTKLAYYNAKADLVAEVDKYIQTVAPGSAVNAVTLVEKCDEYNFDLKFALVQAHKESHFGTKGVASKTNSIYNIGAYDGMSADQLLKKRRGYKHPDYSIEPYIKKILKDYLVNGKSELDLLKKSNFVDKHGHRYASYKDYEIDLGNMYNKIDSIADITNTYKIFHYYKCLLEK